MGMEIEMEVMRTRASRSRALILRRARGTVGLKVGLKGGYGL